MSDPVGVVLAAGAGRRYLGPTPKLLAPFRGRPLVTWVVDAAREALTAPIVVVTGAVDLRPVLPPEVEVVPNPGWADGMATSLRVGIAVADRRGADAVVVGLGDQPLVPAGAWARVAAEESPIAVATFGDEARPPVRLARSVWDLLPRRGDLGARALRDRRPDLVTEVPCPGRADDIDTVEDLERWS